MGRTIENNNVTVSGVITKDFQYSHEVYGEKFYVSAVESKRTSRASDFVPITVSERLVDVDAAWAGQKVTITGSFRSYNKYTETGKHLILSVFVDEIKCVDNSDRDENEIHLDGYICKEAQYRETPLGREIADVLLAVNRPYGKSDYIPCIAWGRNARYASGLDVGTRISITGRVQSREYLKRFENDTTEIRVAYEVSAQEISVVEESEAEDESRGSE